MPDTEPKVWPRQKPRKSAPAPGETIEELDFTVEQWSVDGSRVDEILARAGHVLVARIAFYEAARQRPSRRVVLRQASRLICDSTKPEPKKLDEWEALDASVADAVMACEGDVLAALRASLVANGYLEAEIERLAAALAGAVRAMQAPRGVEPAARKSR
jgi:hypothetical protein